MKRSRQYKLLLSGGRGAILGLAVFIVAVHVSNIACTRLKSVDFSLHEKKNGDMGLGIMYREFKWRFTNNTRLVHRDITESECIWQATLHCVAPDPRTVAIGFRFFDSEGNVVDEAGYLSQKGIYPDSIAQFFTLLPDDSAKTIRGSLWIGRDEALRAVDGDIYVMHTLRDTTLTDTGRAAPDTSSMEKDSLRSGEPESGGTI